MTHHAATRGDDRLSFCRKKEQKALTAFLVYIHNSSIPAPKGQYSCAWTRALCARIPKKKKKVCMFFIAFSRHRPKSRAPVSTFSRDRALQSALALSFTAGIKTFKPTAGKWGREVDCHTQNNAVLYFCFRNAIEEQSQAAGKHSLHSS